MLFRHGLAVTDNNWLCLHSLGNAYAERGDYVNAADCYRRSVAINPANFKAWVSLGDASGRLGRVDEAERCFRIAIEMNPDLAMVHYNLGILLYEQNRAIEALPHFLEYLKKFPSDAFAQQMVASLLAGGRP